MAIVRVGRFLLLKALLLVYVGFFLQRAWFGSISLSAYLSENPIDNDLGWPQFEGKYQRELFLRRPAAFDININLVHENQHKKGVNHDGLNRDRKTRQREQGFKNRQNSIAERRRKVTENVYGKGCGDNPFRGRLRKLLKYWNRLVSAYKMEYFLCYGSLLGYHRTRDVIPYDHDIDICMNRRDFHSLIKLESKRPFRFQDGKPHLVIQRNYSNARRMNCKGRLVHEKVDPCSILSPSARVVLGLFNFIDVYLYRTGNEYASKPNLKLVEREIYPVKSCSFMGLEARCPYDASVLLMRFYGADDGWNRPHHVCRNGEWIANGKNVTERKLQWALEIMQRHKNRTQSKHAF